MKNIERYICPICGRAFVKSEDVAKHSLKCWREQNPNHKSKPAPRSEDKVSYDVDGGVLKFFAMLKGESND